MSSKMCLPSLAGITDCKSKFGLALQTLSRLYELRPAV